MSAGYSQNGVYVDVGLLRDHISKLREEKKLATRLYEKIAVMKAVADPMDAYQYDVALRDVGQMIEYFSEMANQLTTVCDEAVSLSRELGGMIKDSADLNRRVISEKFVL